MRNHIRILIVMAVPFMWAACSGSVKPDPLQSVKGKLILKRSTPILPEWVTVQKLLWIKNGTLEIRVVDSGVSEISNALYRSTNTLPEQTRIVIRDDLRDRWMGSGAVPGEKDRRLTTAITLNTLLPAGCLAVISNSIKVTNMYWELYQQKEKNETVRAYSVYHLVLVSRKEIEKLLKNRLRTAKLTSGSPEFRKTFAGWINSGAYTMKLPDHVSAAATNSPATNTAVTNR